MATPTIVELATVIRVIERVLPVLMKTGLSTHADRVLEVLMDILPYVADELAAREANQKGAHYIASQRGHGVEMAKLEANQ